MAQKKKPVKKTSVTNSRWPLLRVVIAVGVVLGIGYFLILDPYLDNRDKQKFLDAQAFIEETYDEKILPVAEPDSVEREESCRYSSVKYGQGDLSCSFSIDAKFESVSYEESLEISKQLSRYFEANLQNSRNSNRKVSIDDLHVDKVDDRYLRYRIYQKIDNEEGLFCSISYNYPINQESEVLRTSIGCSGMARAEHFTIE